MKHIYSRFLSAPRLTVAVVKHPNHRMYWVEDGKVEGGRRLVFEGAMANAIMFAARLMNFTWVYEPKQIKVVCMCECKTKQILTTHGKLFLFTYIDDIFITYLRLKYVYVRGCVLPCCNKWTSIIYARVVIVVRNLLMFVGHAKRKNCMKFLLYCLQSLPLTSE